MGLRKRVMVPIWTAGNDIQNGDIVESLDGRIGLVRDRMVHKIETDKVINDPGTLHFLSLNNFQKNVDNPIFKIETGGAYFRYVKRRQK